MPEAVSVYVFGEGGKDALVKVGFAVNPLARAKQLRAHLPNGRMLYQRQTLPGPGRKVERAAHQMLRSHCIGGEWFATDAETAVMAVDGAFSTHSAPDVDIDVSAVRSAEFAWVRRVREHMGWSVREFARRSGVQVQTLCRIEAGDVGVSCMIVCRLYAALEQVGWHFNQTIPGSISHGVLLVPPGGAGVRLKDKGGE